MLFQDYFKFDLDTCTRKPAGSPSLPAACLVTVDMSPNNEFISGFLKYGFSVLYIKPVMIGTNYTLCEMRKFFFISFCIVI